LIADDVIIGHPGKASLLSTRDFAAGAATTIGSRCILRSGSVVYEDAVVGNNVQIAHHVIVREQAQIGDGCVFGNGTVIREGAVLGRNVRAMECVVISEGAEVGDDVFIGPNVSFTAGRHMTGAMEAGGLMTRDDAARQEGRFWTGPSVVVESEVRIGANAVVLAGVRLGRGCVVAAGTVVSTDIPPGATVAGNPGRIVKRGPAPMPQAPADPAARPAPQETNGSPGAVMALHHIGVAVASIAAALPSYERLFGLRPLAAPVSDPIQKVTVCFLTSGRPGETLLELVEPGSADSPIASLLKKGGGAYHVCYQVESVEATIARLRRDGCIVVSGPVPAAAFEGKPIAWLYTPTRQLIELVQK
jgi:methylmalonyl-CoA/ethylmalonyl-CoA epimerase